MKYADKPRPMPYSDAYQAWFAAAMRRDDKGMELAARKWAARFMRR